LKNLDENHLAKILLRRSARTVRADHFDHERIKLPDQCASRLIIMMERTVNQRACIRIIHVVESASTPLAMTGRSALRLQFCHKERRFPSRRVDLVSCAPKRVRRRREVAFPWQLKKL
jgi:hypothetical protein